MRILGSGGGLTITMKWVHMRIIRQFNYIVSNINRVLVQDRIIYDLHNTKELMIMQMTEKREGSKREVK